MTSIVPDNICICPTYPSRYNFKKKSSMKILHPSSTTLYCFYDFSLCPASYDFFAFLYSAEICRIRRKLDHIEIILIQGPTHNFRGDSLRTKEVNDTFLLNAIIPGLSILPSIKSYFWTSRESLNINDIDNINIFPSGYQLDRPTSEYKMEGLSSAKLRGDKPGFFCAPTFAKNMAQKFIETKIGNRPFITVTTREENRGDYDIRRINKDMWFDIFKKLKQKGITPVVVRDTKNVFSKSIYDGILEISTASVHLPFRLALYEKALCNFTRNNGTATLKLFSKSEVRYFAEFTEDRNFLSEKWWEANYGMTPGSQFPMTTTTSEVIWGPEDPNYILETVGNLSEKTPPVEKLHEFHSIENYRASLATALGHFIKNVSFGVLPEDAMLFEALQKHGVNDLKSTLLEWQTTGRIPKNTLEIMEGNYNVSL
jgi:hypothetical protein